MMKAKTRKPKAKSKGKETPKQIAKKLEGIGDGMVADIKKGKDPSFKTQLRGRSNVEFDEDRGILTLGDKETTRNFLNIGHARKFMQTTMVAAKTRDYLNQNKTASIREVYYELKHTVPNSKENTFDGQTESDAVIVDLEHSVNTIREKLNLHANPKGTLYGDITLKDKMHHNDKFNCAKLGRGGWSVMSRLEPEEIEIVSVNAKYVLVIETEAMYERLVEEQFAKKNHCILVSTGGQAARGTRRLINRLNSEKKLPVIVFTDGDPYGWYIYSVIKQGSMALAAHSQYLACPEAQYVGMTLHDVETYGLENVTERMKDGDIKRAKEMLEYPWFKNKLWQNQLKKAIREKIRIEQQALANKSLEFVATEYLPKKIKEKDFLP
ncbi:MAG: DNA topoisomerase VI [Candidatus Diapherotrites archaeon]|uniref:Type 2 DNA topoisomerase 6 subunit A n=1 Tax=Candidatus Iainarchaeum sp. TaxID=3101447 RepID=A0A2D6M1D0_9ARCH|nr:DNA topoisomerase VI [Candidatus Diapherotrites archaeon]|tara:strand:+ start:3194 stop:4336 length:1143 start_codon:yes stop_codon:yes gene_type:complete